MRRKRLTVAVALAAAGAVVLTACSSSKGGGSTSASGSNAGNMVFDSKGRLFVAMPGGVQFFDEEMRFSGQLSRPIRERVRMVLLVKDTLCIACGGTVWKRKVKSMGVLPPKP